MMADMNLNVSQSSPIQLKVKTKTNIKIQGSVGAVNEVVEKGW